MFSSVKIEGRSESFAGERSRREKERERGEDNRITFWIGVMDWMIYALGYKEKARKVLTGQGIRILSFVNITKPLRGNQ